IIIIDNNSNDGTVEWIKEQSGIKYILNKENKGFPVGCNQGIEIAEKDNDIFLLNNDTVIMPNSIFNLRMGLYSDEKLGATGAVSNSVSYYQEISEHYENFDEYMEFALKNNITNETFYEERIKLIGFAMMIKRNVLDKVGLLDERFTPGNFEDDDISFRILMAGYKLLLCKDSYIHHFGSVSFKSSNLKYNELILINSNKFKEKWGFSVEYSTFIRNEIIELIQEDNDSPINVLEVGCACGATLLGIKNKFKNSNIYGIELDNNAAKIAKCFADVRDDNIEISKLTYEEEYFDYIIFADVLEHLYDPQTVLENIKKYLKNDGYILASIPNVMHYSVIKDLLKGNWTYENAGILDKTHIRFFTKNEIIKMFNNIGYTNISMSNVNLYVNDQDEMFINEINKISNIDIKNEVKVYQYIIKANSDLGLIHKSKNEITKKKNNYFISNSCDIRGVNKINFGEGVVIQEDCWLNIALDNEQKEIMLDIKCGTNIGRRSVISVSNKIVIGEKVLIAPNVYITDHGHEFNDINIPIMDQGINTISNRVKIGDGTWIGINSSIIGNVSIGKNCVIGANSFVNTNIPDYSVAVGSPAKIIKMFNFISNKWEIIRKDSDVQEILKNREVLKD
ncbi:methyltransferase domain-containing protein, partial [Clostridium botulinum]|nr:methyltransferase domain-containing protein [Clostridium botulinum]